MTDSFDRSMCFSRFQESTSPFKWTLIYRTVRLFVTYFYLFFKLLLGHFALMVYFGMKIRKQVHASLCSIGALIIGIGSWGPLYYSYNNEPPNNSIGNFQAPIVGVEERG